MAIKFEDIKNFYIITCWYNLGTGDDRIPIFFKTEEEAKEYFVKNICKKDPKEYSFNFLAKEHSLAGGNLRIETVLDDLLNYEEFGDGYSNEGFLDRNDYINLTYNGFMYNN